MFESFKETIKSADRQVKKEKTKEKAGVEKMAESFQNFDRDILEHLHNITDESNAPDLGRPDLTELIHEAAGQALGNKDDQEVYERVLAKKQERGN
jgi:hypothetical protein